jgi:hypothetical protein
MDEKQRIAQMGRGLDRLRQQEEFVQVLEFRSLRSGP